MTESSTEKNLELSVTNFGPIAKAEIDLRPMTVFVGPSNTGKSYLAILIYALHRFFSGNYGDRRRLGTMPRVARRRSRHLQDEITDVDIAGLAHWIDDMVSSGQEGSPSDESSGQLPAFVAPLVRSMLRDLESSEDIADEILRSFGVAGANSLVRHRSRRGLKVALKQEGPEGSHPMGPSTHTLAMNRTTSELESSIPDDEALYIKGVDDLRSIGFDFSQSLRRELVMGDDDERRRAAAYVVRRLSDSVIRQSLGPLSRIAHYLPADRTGIMHAHLVAVASVIERSPYTALRRDNPLPELSGVLADFLTQLVRIGGLRRGTEAGMNLADRLQEKMINGVIHVEDSITGYPEFYYQPEGWNKKLPLMNTSSMVSELAPVVLYLRHVVRPGEVLIIEEPESHLHPAMQVEFIRHLAAAVREGVRIMLTTHSEWVLDELANLVRLSDLSSESGKGIVRAELALSRDDVGVWLFEHKQRPKGSVVRELPLSEEYGGFASDFNEVAMGTYNDWARVANLIEEDGER